MVSPIDWRFRKKLSGGLTPILMDVSHIALARVTISVAKTACSQHKCSALPGAYLNCDAVAIRDWETFPKISSI
jgi:hypothetical protein